MGHTLFGSSDWIVGPNTGSCEFVCLFVPGNIHEIYYEVNLNYCNHWVSRSSMTGVATLPTQHCNSLVDKAPGREGAATPLPNPQGRRGGATRGRGRKKGGWRAREEWPREDWRVEAEAVGDQTINGAMR